MWEGTFMKSMGYFLEAVQRKNIYNQVQLFISTTYNLCLITMLFKVSMYTFKCEGHIWSEH